MLKRATFVLLALFLLAVVAFAGPAGAGTNEVHSLTGSIGRPVNYHDFHYTQNDKPMGEWQSVSVSANPGRDCFMQAKWGNFGPAFGQLKMTGGTACKWGGLIIWYYYSSPSHCCDGLERMYVTSGDYCVATSTAYQTLYCAQLSDGSIFMQRTPSAGATMNIVQAEFIVCANRFAAMETVECNHDYYELSL